MYVNNKSWSHFLTFFNEKNSEKFRQFLTEKNNFESQNCAVSFNSKTIERPKIFLWLFSQSIGFAYSPLNSAACRKISEVKLTYVQKVTFYSICSYSTSVKQTLEVFFTYFTSNVIIDAICMFQVFQSISIDCRWAKLYMLSIVSSMVCFSQLSNSKYRSKLKTSLI